MEVIKKQRELREQDRRSKCKKNQIQKSRDEQLVHNYAIQCQDERIEKENKQQKDTDIDELINYLENIELNDHQFDDFYEQNFQKEQEDYQLRINAITQSIDQQTVDEQNNQQYKKQEMINDNQMYYG